MKNITKEENELGQEKGGGGGGRDRIIAQYSGGVLNLLVELF